MLLLHRHHPPSLSRPSPLSPSSLSIFVASRSTQSKSTQPRIPKIKFLNLRESISSLLCWSGFAMADAQSWTATRRGSNPRLLDSNDHLVLDIPATPIDEFQKGTMSPFVIFLPTLSPAVTAAAASTSWYLSNIGVLLLNKYLLSLYGFRYPIFLTMLHILSCSNYSYFAITFLRLVHFQQILSRTQFLKIFALSAIFFLFCCCWQHFLEVHSIGATTPFFTAVFAFLITYNKER